MVSAKRVLEAAVTEAAEQARAENIKIPVVRDLTELAYEALLAGNGEISDERVKNSSLHPSQITRLLLEDA